MGKVAHYHLRWAQELVPVYKKLTKYLDIEVLMRNRKSFIFFLKKLFDTDTTTIGICLSYHSFILLFVKYVQMTSN